MVTTIEGENLHANIDKFDSNFQLLADIIKKYVIKIPDSSDMLNNIQHEDKEKATLYQLRRVVEIDSLIDVLKDLEIDQKIIDIVEEWQKQGKTEFCFSWFDFIPDDVAECFKIINHPLLNKNLIVPMPDGFNYLIPITFIAQHRAKHFDKNFGGDKILSLIHDTLPLFENDESQIHDWAKNIAWNEIKMHSNTEKIQINEDEMQKSWINSLTKIR